MAELTNGLHTIEESARAWVHILNDMFRQVYAKTEFVDFSDGYSDDTHTHAIYKLSSTGESEVATIAQAVMNTDIKIIDIAKGVIFKDRTTATYKRMYVDNGTLLVENV